jgi:diacylglycerol kinase family enzyme
MNVVVVYNPKSGSALPEPALREMFERHAIKIDALIGVSKTIAQDLAPYLRKKAAICAIGGDGTLSSVASILAGTEATFVPLPGGTLNHFTKDLGIPQDIDRALKKLAKATVKKVDIAKVNDKLFINNSSIGLYPSSLRARSRFETTLGKWPAAVIASIHALVRFRTYHVTINNETFHTPFVFIGNNEYVIDGTNGVVRKTIHSGKLSVFVAQTISRATLLKIALFALFGRVKDVDEFDIYHVTSLTIHTRKKQLSVSHDGEVSRMNSPLRYEIKPGSLNVRC